jgi:hypothetical protein
MPMDISEPLARCGFERIAGRWRIPIAADVNIGQEAVGRHAQGAGGSTALMFEDADGKLHRWSFFELDAWAVRVAARMAEIGCAAASRSGSTRGSDPRQPSRIWRCTSLAPSR